MEPNKDFKELLELFSENSVEFVIVGAYPLAFHGAPRFTGDLDPLVRPDSQNASRILRALDIFGFGSVGLQTRDFSELDQIIQLGVPPLRIDLLTSISGVSWEQAWAKSGFYHDLPVFFLGKDEFISNKKAAGRPQDLADVAALDIQLH